MQNEPLGLLNALLRKISEGILWINLDGTIAATSESLQKILKVSLKNILYQPFWDVFPDEYFGFSMRESLRYGLSYQLIYKGHLEISTSFFYQGPKYQHGLIVIVCDIAERQKFQQLAAQSDRMKELGEMAARLAHEIRNPLGGIRGFSTLLYRDLSTQPHLQEMVSQILEGARGLENLVTTILEYTRPLCVSLETHDMAGFLRSVTRFIKVDPSFPSNIRLMLHIPDEPLLAPFDPDVLKRALLNLMVNALQAMPNGGELSVSLMRIDPGCQIAITDTGVGMNEEQLASLFIPFFTTKQKGNGLGLVETKKIVQAHGGSIEARSTLQRGSSFLLTLPLKR